MGNIALYCACEKKNIFFQAVFFIYAFFWKNAQKNNSEIDTSSASKSWDQNSFVTFILFICKIVKIVYVTKRFKCDLKCDPECLAQWGFKGRFESPVVEN